MPTTMNGIVTEDQTRTGDELRQYREHLDFSQDALANWLGLSRITVVNREGKARVKQSVYDAHTQALDAMDANRRDSLNPSR